jgi:ATP-dependent DNA helicase RecG
MSRDEERSLRAQLRERFRNREELDLEFKKGTGGVPESLWETVSAFANTRGGWIVLGINDNGEFVGVKNPDARIKELFDQGRNPSKINREVWGENDIFKDEIEGCSIVVVRVPAAPHAHRPIFINGKHIGGTYVRRNEGDYRCSQDEVYRMIRDADPLGGDHSLIDGLTNADLDTETVSVFRQRFQNREPASPLNNYPDIRFLQAIGALDRDSLVTVAGLLMFGRSEDILRWRKHHLIDYRTNGRSIHDPTWLDRIPMDGNLFTAFLSIYPKLIGPATRPHQVVDAIQAGESPVQLALREAFVNLLVHADYKEKEPSLVIQAPEGYLFRNPGASLVSVHDLLHGNRSTPRNPTLHRMFRLVGLVDQAGTGFPKILQAWREQGLEMPDLELENERYEFKLFLRTIHLLTPEERQWLLAFPSLKSDAQVALVLARTETFVTPETLASRLAIHENDGRNLLLQLEGKGLLEQNGGFFRLSEKSLRLAESVTIVDKTITSSGESVTEVGESVTEITEGYKIRVRAALGKVTSRSERRSLIEGEILRLTSKMAVSSAELAEVFQLRRETLYRQYLKPLLAREELVQGVGMDRGKYIKAPISDS